MDETEKQEKSIAMIDELSSYIYGMMILAIIMSVMVLIHIGLDYFFHVIK